MPKKNAFLFLHSLLGFLCEKWNLIDHHRINKFMQLVRYLVKQAMKVSQKKLDDVLMKTVFSKMSESTHITKYRVWDSWSRDLTIFRSSLRGILNQTRYSQQIVNTSLSKTGNFLKTIPSTLHPRITEHPHRIENLREVQETHYATITKQRRSRASFIKNITSSLNFQPAYFRIG